jgi:hypothetical protein
MGGARETGIVRPVFRGRSPWLVVSLSVMMLGGLVMPAAAGAGTARQAARPKAEPATGTIQVCASAQHGMETKTFHFSVNGRAPVQVVGGACSAAILAAAGNATITEAAMAKIEVTAIRANHSVARDLTTGTVTVDVKAGSTPDAPTVATFFNVSKAQSNGTPTTGTIEICKSSLNGMAGKAFQFSLNGAAPITVVGGGCSPSIVTPAGPATVTEAPNAGTEVAAVKARNTVSKDLSTGTVTVNVKAGSTPANEELVTFINKVPPALGLKICKAADPSSLSLVGDLFSFSENNGPAFSVGAGTVDTPVCGPITKYPMNTVVNVSELPTAFTHASAISVSDNRGTNVDAAAGTATATIGSGVTVVTYTNAVNPLPQSGFVEVCKDAGDQFVTGTFAFTITAPGFTSSQTVAVGQCSSAIQVPAGEVSVAETAQFPYTTKSVKVVPTNRLVTKNVANATATVTVPVGDSSTETQIAFTNQTLTGQIKVCKTLTANSTALAGSSFTFTVTSATGHPQTDTVVAGAAGSTACVMHPTALPLGSAVSITETGAPNVQNVGVSVSPASQDAGSAAPTANVTVGTGVTTATFTNEAFATLELCKIAADPSTATQTFQYSVNGGAPVSVHAGQCSLPVVVPAGTATVNEVGRPNFHLVGVTAVGPTLDNRLTSASNANPATVLVPFGGVANETVVTFTNAVDTGQLKICKVSTEPTLQGITFNFTYSYTVNGVTTNGTAALTPGSCSSLSGSIPVVDANGLAIPVSVAEVLQPTAIVSNIAVANGTLVTSNLAAGTSTVNVAVGVTLVTFTNVRTPLGTLQVCKIAADASTATQTFQFSVNGGAAISVPAGQCSPTLSVLSGTASVQEVASTNFHLVGITATGPLNVNRLTTGSTVNPALATVPPGDATNTTVVTFTDAVNTGQLTICKTSTEPTLQSTAFAFSYQYTVPGGPVSASASLVPGACSTPSAAIPVVDAAGNAIPIAITETATLGVDVSSIAVTNGTLTATNLAGGTATANVKQGTTTVTYTNVLKPARTMQICKTAADASTAGQTFQFSVNGGSAISVTAGSCSGAIALPTVGETASVQELSSTNFHVAGVAAAGPTNDNRLTSTGTANPATVSVPFGGAANVTKVTFTDAVNTGQLQLCKASADPALQNTAFQLSWSYAVNGTPATGSTSLMPGQCSTVPAAIPVVDAAGNAIAVAISETATVGVDVSNIGIVNGSLSGSNLGAGTTTATVKQGMTTVTYTNTSKPARTLVVCKIANDPETATQTFNFSVNGGASFPVSAGQCSSAITLPTIGETASVQELGSTNFHLLGVTAVGPLLDNRLASASNATATVTTPFGGVANQTTVTFTNAVNTTQLVMCKSNPDGTLSGDSFAFSFAYVSGVDTGGGSAALAPGACSAASAPIPVVDPSGNPVLIQVQEAAFAGATLVDASIVNGTITVTEFDAGIVEAVASPGTTTVTLVNNATAQGS